MKKIFRTAMSVLLMLCLAFSELAPAAIAEDSASGEDNVFDLAEENASEEASSGIIYSDDAIVEESDAVYPENSYGSTNEGTEILPGEEVLPDDNETSTVGDDLELGFDEIDENEIVFDDEDEDSVSPESEGGEDEIGEESGEIGLDISSLWASSTNVVVEKGKAQTITVSYSGISTPVCLQYATSSKDYYSLKWGSWSGKTIPLTITGKANGTGKVTLRLQSKLLGIIPLTKTITINVTVCSASISLTSSSVTIREGNSVSLTATLGGYSGAGRLYYSTNNASAFSLKFGSWSSNGKSIPLTITGNKSGTGSITLYYKTTSGTLLAQKTINITVTPKLQKPTLTLSASSTRIPVGGSNTISITYGGYSGSVRMRYSTTNSKAYSASFGSWRGSTMTLSVKGVATGSGVITIYLIDAKTNAVLTQTDLKVSVYQNDNPQMTLSPSSMSIQAGKSATLTAKVSGVSGGYYLSYSSSNASVFSCAHGNWSNGSLPFTISGKNAGSGTMTVTLRRSDGTALVTKKVSVTITAAPVLNPTLTASTQSVSISKNGSASVRLTYSNCNEAAYLLSSQVGSGFTTAWGTQSGNSAYLTIKGASQGNGSVVVQLKRKSDNKVLASVQISVTVTGPSVYDVGFSFPNYGTSSYSLESCQLIYGKTQLAKTIQSYNLGRGGVCFGMASTAAMIYSGADSLGLGQFSGNKSNVYGLTRDATNYPLGMSLKSVIEGIYVSELSGPVANSFAYGCNNVAKNIVSEIDKGNTIVIGVFRPVWNSSKRVWETPGHSVIAYAYTLTGNTLKVTISDSNNCASPQEMTFTRPSAGSAYNTWYYSPSGGSTYGTVSNGDTYGSAYNDNGYIRCVSMSAMKSMWAQRGKITSEGYSYWYGSGNANLFITSEKSFTLYKEVPDETLTTLIHEEIAHFQDGIAVSLADDVNMVSLTGDDPDPDSEGYIFLYVPNEYYYIEDGTPDDGMEASLVDVELSVSVRTDADSFNLYADDKTDTVGALLDLAEGDGYSVTIGSSRESDPDMILLEGTGNGKSIEISMTSSELQLTGTDDAVLSMSNDLVSYMIEAACSEGGSITPSGADLYDEGQNCCVSISPDEGYVISAVYVDGENIGSPASYCFENISASHQIYAEFKKDISTLQIELSSYGYIYDGEEKRPEVTVKTEDGDLLTEGEDYTLSYSGNSEAGEASVFVIAETDSIYSGFAEVKFTITDSNALTAISYDSSRKAATVSLINKDAGTVCAAVYDSEGRLVVAKTADVGPETCTVTFDFLDVSMPENYRIKAFFVDENGSPNANSIETNGAIK